MLLIILTNLFFSNHKNTPFCNFTVIHEWKGKNVWIRWSKNILKTRLQLVIEGFSFKDIFIITHGFRYFIFLLRGYIISWNHFFYTSLVSNVKHWPRIIFKYIFFYTDTFFCGYVDILYAGIISFTNIQQRVWSNFPELFWKIYFSLFLYAFFNKI